MLHRPIACIAVLMTIVRVASAQELEPRAYAPNPTGASFALLAYAHTSGEVVFDASLPFRDVNAAMNTGSLMGGHTFGLLGRSASASFGLPYVWGTLEGSVGERFGSISRSGLGDVRARLAVNLVGGPALGVREFAARRPRTTLGTSLIVVAPTGQYDPAKLINLGANRWALKPELGLSHPTGHWFLELYAGAWLFTDNDAFFGGQHREQEPLGSFQAHAAYTFRPRLWLAGDATFYTGGRTTVGAVGNTDKQSNSRVGLTVSLPIRRRHSVKVAWASGFTTRVGGDFDTFSIAWQTLWLPRVQ